MQKELITYDTQFKQVVVGMLECGEIKSIEEARRIFRIGGNSTISKWIKKFGKENILPKRKIKKFIDEVDTIENKEVYEKVLIHLSGVESGEK